MQAGREINRMYEERVAADYDVEHLTDAATARAGLVKDRKFLDVRASRFGFSTP